MPIPTTRAELIDQVSEAFSKLQTELRDAGYDIAPLICVDDWSVKDVLAVRAWWTHAVIDWVEAGKRQQTIALPADGYGWNETPRLNGDTVTASSGDSLESILDRLEAGYERVLKCVDSLSDEDLLDVGAFPWAGKWPVSRWISLNTARQYTTARSFIRRAMRDQEHEASGPEGHAL